MKGPGSSLKEESVIFDPWIFDTIELISDWIVKAAL